MSQVTDHHLMTEVKEGNVERLAMLFERHHIMIYNFFLRLTGNRGASEDLVQETFLRILKYRSTYLGQEGFTVWLYTIARNAHYDFLRKKKNEVPIEAYWNDLKSQEPSPPDNLERTQEIARLGRALATLPLKKREVLILCRFQNLKYSEIAELLGCRVGTVKAFIHRSIKDLGKAYRELFGGIPS